MGLWGKIFGKKTDWGPHGFADELAADLSGRGWTFELGKAVVFVDRDGERRTYGLSNLADLCAQQPRSEWRQTIARHFDNLLASERESREVGERARSFDDVRALLRTRLHGRDQVDQMGGSLCSLPAADDLTRVLSYDLPSSVVTVPHKHVERWGRPVSELMDIGLANVQAEGKLQVDEMEHGLVALEGSSFCSASHALLLDDYVELDAARGALVIVPQRHVVVFHAIRDARGTIEAVSRLVLLANGLYERGPGSISRSLYWWRGEALTRLPAIFANRQLSFIPPQEFVDMLDLAA